MRSEASAEANVLLCSTGRPVYCPETDCCDVLTDCTGYCGGG